MSATLSERISDEIEDKWFFTRTWNVLKTTYQEKGVIPTAKKTAALIIAPAFTATWSYFCCLGAERSIKAFIASDKTISNFNYLGNAGGWVALAGTSLYVTEIFLVELIRSGEYEHLLKIIKNWIDEKQQGDDPVELDKIYSQVSREINTYNDQGFFPKNTFETRLDTLKMFKSLNIIPTEESYVTDKNLQKIFKKAQRELKEKSRILLSLKQIFTGPDMIRPSFFTKLKIVVTGILAPIVLTSTSVLSVVGMAGLGYNTLTKKENLPEIGHFGEWPDNALQAFILAVLIFNRLIINEAEFKEAKRVLLRIFATNQVSQEALRNIFNHHLSKIAAVCHYIKLDDQYIQ
jgi:hypothetical protein